MGLDRPFWRRSGAKLETLSDRILRFEAQRPDGCIQSFAAIARATADVDATGREFVRRCLLQAAGRAAVPGQLNGHADGGEALQVRGCVQRNRLESRKRISAAVAPWRATAAAGGRHAAVAVEELCREVEAGSNAHFARRPHVQAR